MHSISHRHLLIAGDSRNVGGPLECGHFLLQVILVLAEVLPPLQTEVKVQQLLLRHVLYFRGRCPWVIKVLHLQRQLYNLSVEGRYELLVDCGTLRQRCLESRHYSFYIRNLTLRVSVIFVVALIYDALLLLLIGPDLVLIPFELPLALLDQAE